jgi:tRNA(Ile2) C34 agmatinyltransferase TiaS
MNKVTLLPASAGQGWLCKSCGQTIRPEEIKRPDQEPPDGFKNITKNG